MPPPAIKAIPTFYAGHYFRSRMEARWAVFFDTFGIKWEYEKEGYDLPCGPYLPDFWLPEVSAVLHDPGIWFEVKPTAPSEDELMKCFQLSVFSGKPAIIASGVGFIEGCGTYQGTLVFAIESNGRYSHVPVCESNVGIRKCLNSDCDSVFFGFSSEYKLPCFKCGANSDIEFFTAAAIAAQCERFESPKRAR